LRQRAVEQYRFDLLTWAVLAPARKKKKDPPAVPEILRNGNS